MNKIITICGPTGVGKTGFAIALANQFNGEIIGADSMQVYKYMDIGTAKPNVQERAMAVHHLVDFLDPKKEFDAGKFACMASDAINQVVAKGKLPIVAGGTGLYIRALLHGLFREASICKDTVARLEAELATEGGQALYERLQACDPKAAEKIHPHDGFRIIRALEVFETTGIPISGRQQAHNFQQDRYNSLTLGLHMDRETLYERINLRVDMMLDQGLLREVEDLVDQGYDLDLKPMQSIGYRHMGMFIKGEVDFEEAVRLLKRDTRRYAKRQFTWFRKEPGLVWVDPSDTKAAFKMVKEFLTSPLN